MGVACESRFVRSGTNITTYAVDCRSLFKGHFTIPQETFFSDIIMTSSRNGTSKKRSRGIPVGGGIPFAGELETLKQNEVILQTRNRTVRTPRDVVA